MITTPFTPINSIEAPEQQIPQAMQREDPVQMTTPFIPINTILAPEINLNPPLVTPSPIDNVIKIPTIAVQTKITIDPDDMDDYDDNY